MRGVKATGHAGRFYPLDQSTSASRNAVAELDYRLNSDEKPILGDLLNNISEPAATVCGTYMQCNKCTDTDPIKKSK